MTSRMTSPRHAAHERHRTRRSHAIAHGFGLLLALIAALFPAAASAATVRSVDASLTATQVATGESFQLIVRVSADARGTLPWPQVSGLEPFTVSRERGTSVSSQTSIVNGVVSRSETHVTSFVYTLIPREAGTYTIGPIRYAHDGFDRDLGRAVVTVSDVEPAITTRTSVSKPRAYVGEQVLYTLRIVPENDVQSINLPQDLQKLIGERFYFQQLDREITRTTAMVDGREAAVFDVRIALFPLLAGTAALEGIPVEYRRLRPGASQAQSMFDMFFGGGSSLITQSTVAAPLRLQAVALPDGAPEGFTGAVGTHVIRASLDRQVVAAGEPVTLTVTIRGNGQPKSITGPQLPRLQNFEVYAPEESGSSAPEGTVLWTTRTFRYVLIPAREGSFAIENIHFPYFDPEAGRYAVATAPRLELRVTPGSGAAVSALAARAEVTELGSDIRHIKPASTPLRDGGRLPHEGTPLRVLALLPPLLLAGAWAWRRRLDRLRGDAAYSRRVGADAALRRRLKAARTALEASAPREFYRALSDAVIAFPSDRLNREFRGLTTTEATALLAARGASAETAGAYDTLLQRCDFVLFAGMSPGAEEMRRDLESATALLRRLDKELA